MILQQILIYLHICIRDDVAQLVCTLPCPVQASGDCSGSIVALFCIEEDNSLDILAATEDKFIFVWRHVWADTLHQWFVHYHSIELYYCIQ